MLYFNQDKERGTQVQTIEEREVNNMTYERAKRYYKGEELKRYAKEEVKRAYGTYRLAKHHIAISVKMIRDKHERMSEVIWWSENLADWKRYLKEAKETIDEFERYAR